MANAYLRRLSEFLEIHLPRRGRPGYDKEVLQSLLKNLYIVLLIRWEYEKAHGN